MQSLHRVPYFWILLLFTLLISTVSAQTDWTADFVLDPFPSPYLSDWQNNPAIGQAIIFNGSSETVNVRLRMTIVRSGKGQVASGSSRVFSFPPGASTDLRTTDLIDYGSIDYDKSYEDIAVRTGRLPEGEYEACLRIETESGSLILDRICATFTIVYPDPPYLVFPIDGESILSKLPIFQWTAVQTPVGYSVNYNIRIAEMLEGQSPAQSLSANYPHFERSNLINTNLQYPLDGPGFVKGKRYAWQVQALDSRGYPPSANNGRSEIWTFLFDADTTTPIEYKRLAGRVTDSATGEPLVGATVIYRPVTMHAESGDTTWEESDDSLVVHSGANGAYRIDSAYNRSYFSLAVSKDEYVSKLEVGKQNYQTNDIADHTIRMTYAPPGQKRLAGIVRDFFSNEPVPNVTVTYHLVNAVTTADSSGANQTTYNEISRKQLTTLTDAEGRFEFTQAADSAYFSLRASNPPAYMEAVEVGQPQYQRGDIDNYVLLMKPNACNITGTVNWWSSEGAKPVPGIMVQLTRKCTIERHTVIKILGGLFRTESTTRDVIECGPRVSAYTGATGRFIFPRLMPHNPADFDRTSSNGNFFSNQTTVVRLVSQHYGVVIDDPKFKPYAATDSIEFTPGETIESGEHLLTARSGSIVGIVASDSVLVEGADVYLYPASRRTQTPSDSRGASEGGSAGSGKGSKSGGQPTVSLSAAQTPTDTSWGATQTERPSGEPLARVLTDDKGAYFFATVPINDPMQTTDQYQVWVETQGFTPTVRRARLEREGEADTVNFQMQRVGGVVYGTVTGSDSKEVSGARVELYVRPASANSSAITTSAADSLVSWVQTAGNGAFSFANLQPSAYRLAISRTGYTSQQTDTFAITWGDKYRRDITLDQAQGAIAVTVTDKEKKTGLRDVTVKSPQIPSLIGYTADSGKIVFDAVADTVTVQFRMIGYADLDTSVVVKANDTIKLEVALGKRTGEYRVTVVEKGSSPKKTLQNIDVMIGKQDTVYTDMNGVAFFKTAPIGKQKIKAVAPSSDSYPADYLEYESEVEIREGFNPDTMVIELSPAARISGKVIDKDSSVALSGVTVKLNGNSSVEAKTDKEGKFTLRNVPVKEKLTLSFKKSGYKSKQYTHDKELAVGDKAEGVEIKLERSPLDSLMGFAVVVDSIVTSSGNRNKVWGSLVDIPPCFGMKLKESSTSVGFEGIELDSAYKPVDDTITLTTKELSVEMFGIDATMKLSDGLRLEWVDSSKAGRICGDVELKNLFDKIFPDTKLPSFTIPKLKAPSFWAGGVNRGLEKFGLTATGTEVQAKFKGVGLGLDYVKTFVDTAGLHLAGSIIFKSYNVGFENLNIGRDPTTHDIVFKAVTVKTTPPITLKFGVFTFVDSSMTWEATGFRASGAIIVPPLKNWTVGFKDLRISPEGEFLSLTLQLDKQNGTIKIHGQEFQVKSLEYGTENFASDTLPHHKFFAFTGEMRFTKLDKPVELKLRYSEKDQFTGKLTFNQSKTFAGCVTLQIESIELGYDEKKADRFVGFSGGVKFGAVKGLSLQASNLRFWMSGSVTVDEIAADFVAGPAEINIKIHWTDSLFDGKGLIRVKPVFTMGAEFRYAGSQDWWIKVTAGVRVPMGACELVEVRGGIGRKDDTWRFALGGRIAPAKLDKGISLDIDVEVHSTPRGVIVIGNASVEVGSSLQVGRATFELNFPEERIVGSIVCEYNKEALKIAAQIDLGVQFGKYWYIHGKAEIKFLEFFNANGEIVIANNWEWQHGDSVRVMRGIYVELNSDFRIDADWKVIRWGVYFDRYAMLYIGWNGDFAGAIKMRGGANAWIGIDLGVFEISLIQAQASMALAASLSKTGSEWAAAAHGDFSLQATIGYCQNAKCWSICWTCVWRMFGHCIIAFPTGAKACVGMAADINYSTSHGTQVSVSF